MPTTIRLLSESVVRKIAAGEVIERPASVVKELAENSIDAGAQTIHVEIAAGGRQSILVSDDGKGMTRQDAELCTERHATSKMSSPTDLFDIATLGFRGEALASIGAVSRMTLETRCEGDEGGTRISIEGGIRSNPSTIARDVGTAVWARSLFFNTPARRKFLRHMETESRYITQTVSQLAAANPAIAFRLAHEERSVLDLRRGDRQERAGDLLGADPEDLLAAQWEASGLSVQVVLCPPALLKRSRGRQYLIVKGRPIFSRPLSAAIYSGYGGLLPQGCHPSYVLWLELDPRQVDVNVHPTKREVRFANEREVSGAIQHAVAQALEMPEFTPGVTPLPWKPTAASGHSIAADSGAADSGAADSGQTFQASPPESTPCASTGMEQLSLTILAPSSPAAKQMGDSAEDVAALGHIRAAPFLWQLHNKYLVAPIPEGIALIDQHVAHERIRYEEVLGHLDSESAGSQQLLIPLNIDLTAVEMEVYREAEPLLQRVGFSIREFGRGSVIVDAIPVKLGNWSDGEILRQIIGDFQEDVVEARQQARESIAASVACHSSIRAGERLSQEEMVTLTSRLLGTREPFVCPHGRPIMIKIALAEIDRLFGRT